MNAQQEINLAVKTKFAEYGIEFAYPTQIAYLDTLPTGILIKQESMVETSA
jgi:small-conductance mechanosensitive channel